MIMKGNWDYSGVAREVRGTVQEKGGVFWATPGLQAGFCYAAE